MCSGEETHPSTAACRTINLSLVLINRYPMRAATLLVTALSLLAGAEIANALTLEEARQSCRQSVGRPIVQSCMRGGGGSLETCRQTATPKVRACVHDAMNKANGRANVAVPVPKETAQHPTQEATPDSGEKMLAAPPRTIADVTAILDAEKPDSKKIAELQSQADGAPPKNVSRSDLAQFYYDRGNARAQLGRVSDALSDAKAAVERGNGAVDANMMGRLLQFLGLQYSAAGNPKEALAVFSRQIREMNTPGAKGYLFGGHRQIATVLVQMGNLTEAEGYLKRSLALIQEARTSGLPGWRNSYSRIGQSWESDVEATHAILFEARGQFAQAERSYRIAEIRRRASLDHLLKLENPPPATQVLQAADVLVGSQARMKARQGRRIEAEVDARRALLSRLKDQGKYNPGTVRFVMGLADVLVEQGRYGEAENLARVALDINSTVGVAEDSQTTAQILSKLAGILTLEHKREQAEQFYAKLDRAVSRWEPNRREALDVNPGRILSLYAAKQLNSGLSAAQALLKRELASLGEQHFGSATARGLVAIGLSLNGRMSEALREFRLAAPILASSAQEVSDDEDVTILAARNDRVQFILEAYFSLLARDPSLADIRAVESFGFVDALRGRSVERALSASSTRLLIKDQALSALVRRDQDLTKQTNARLSMLSDLLALPSSERDEKGVQAVTDAISRGRTERQKLRADIDRNYPSFADLVTPKPATEGSIRAALREDEVFVSFYFGHNTSFVWALPKLGPLAFSEIRMSAADIQTKVMALREALEPRSETVLDVPAFDLALAYELYQELLAPIEKSWKPARSIVLATNGALGFLPLSLLPIEQPNPPSAEALPFSSYASVHWLARTHSVSTVPSAASFITLRRLPPGSSNREPMIGFGDPIFSADQLPAMSANSDDAVATRGIRLAKRSSPSIDTAELARLPRLPDTADELVSIAEALGARPNQSLKLGLSANEAEVKSAALSHYRVVAFATHGLVPGEINGLNQPALALSAPELAKVPGDGLLTLDEILNLQLDADWVVLSACNTGSAAGAGAEAASGLGRAFFYAGARALLVTNWSVYSQPARQLTAGLFRKQAAEPGMTRSEALRLAMNALIDGPGYQDQNGSTVFSYAHPIFWAPYTIIGDGGSN
jgi:CHAT domain-containing protein